MFNVGDEVEVIVDLPKDYPITRIGSWGTVRQVGKTLSLVEFKEVTGNSIGNNHIYYINNEHLALKASSGLSKVERKIRSIYARQGRRTKLPCFC